MKELSPDTKSLLKAARAGLRPADADRERIRRALAEQLGIPVEPREAEPTQEAPPAVQQTTATLAVKPVGLALWGAGMLAAGVVLWLLLHPAAEVGSPAAGVLEPTVSQLAASSNPAPAVAASELARPTGGEIAATMPQPASTTENAKSAASVGVRSKGDSLAEEVAILSQAAKDLRAGRAAAALVALEQHRRRFPNGLLAEERRAARAEALCQMGQFDAAASELRRLEQSSPGSPQLLRVKELCRKRAAAR